MTGGVAPVPQVQEKFANASLSPEEAAERLLKEAEREVVRKEMEDKDLERGVKGSGVDQDSLASTVQARPPPPVVSRKQCTCCGLHVTVPCAICLRCMQALRVLHNPTYSCVSAVAWW